MDTADTGNEDTGFQHYWEDGHDHRGASELANEAGGVSCNSVGLKPILGLVVVVMFFIFLRRLEKRTDYY